jgi:hypothetical protein
MCGAPSCALSASTFAHFSTIVTLSGPILD